MSKTRNAKDVRRVLKRNMVKYTATVLHELCKDTFKTRCLVAWRIVRKKF